MIGFVLRKTLYDFWDNMFRMVVLNLGFLIVAAIPTFLPVLAAKFTESSVLGLVLTGIGILACSVYLATAAYSLSSVSDHGSFGFGDFFDNIKRAWKAGIAMGIGLCFFIYILILNLDFYSRIPPPYGSILLAIIIWVAIFMLLSAQFYFSVYTRLGGKVFKSYKKCMLLVLDNTGFALFIFIHNLIVLLLPFTVPFMMFIILFPGPAGILLYLDEAIRLRLLKYDWLEVNAGANRKKIPWEELLIEEREKVGTRSFKNFIFPWKD